MTAHQRLSRRLEIVFNHLNPRQDVWDFCCDHGYLGGAAYKSQNFPKIYFVDQVESIIENLKARFNKFAFDQKNQSQAYFLCQSGESISQIITGTICVTGVGGLTIYEILSKLASARNLKANRLILGPHRDDDKLLKLISDNQNLNTYFLFKTETVVEDGRNRHIYIFDQIQVTA